MSRVLARTSMISEERMLNTATSTMIDSAKNIATRSTASASNSEALIVFQSVTTAWPGELRAPAARGSRRPCRRSSVLTSIMPIASPVSSSVCASAIGMTTKRLVVVVDPDLEDRGDPVADLARDRAERGRAALRVDDGDRVADPRAEVLRQPRADRDLAGAGLQRRRGCPPSPCGCSRRMSSAVLPRTSIASTRPLKVASSGCSISGEARITPGRRARPRSSTLLPVVEPAAVGLDDRVAVEPDDLVEQLGAKAVHHAHHDDQRGDAEHDRDQADRRRRAR